MIAREHSPLRWILIAIMSALIAAPIALITTIALMPVWSWIERTTGVESVGHSGPASWCFLTIYSALAVMTFLGALHLQKRPPLK